MQSGMKHNEKKFLDRWYSEILPANKLSFEEKALMLFRYQAAGNPIYEKYLRQLGTQVSSIVSVEDIPCLPITLFRNYEIKTNNWPSESRFYSSGTTDDLRSQHLVFQLGHYHEVSRRCFRQYFGDPSEYRFLALLPGYIERGDSSLVEMIRYFISLNPQGEGGFFLDNYDELESQLSQPSASKTCIIGVTHALLDWSLKCKPKLPPQTLVMETGGMKGRGKELVREELHQILCDHLSVSEIFSEYGMTELFSQFYSLGKNDFFEPDSSRVLIREIRDPFSKRIYNRTGVIKVMDLANAHSCAFIETQDLGMQKPNGSFQVLGRLDNTQARGCNLMFNP